MSASAGYSGTPLARKLGLKDGQKAGFINLPDSLGWLTSERLFADVVRAGTVETFEGEDFDYIHLFTKEAATVHSATPALGKCIKQDGMIWMSWPKKASKVPTDVTEDTIRNQALEGVLVDVKVCAVDAVWSGLKLVIRKEHRV